MDIKLGEYKIQLGKGPKQHKGLDSINEALGTSNYWHVRVGIENRNNERVTDFVKGIKNYGKTRTPGEEYVLQDFTGEEKLKLGETVKRLVDELCKKLAT